MSFEIRRTVSLVYKHVHVPLKANPSATSFDFLFDCESMWISLAPAWLQHLTQLWKSSNRKWALQSSIKASWLLSACLQLDKGIKLIILQLLTVKSILGG